MSEKRETPEERRERLRQEEIKRNPTGNLHDAFHRSSSGSFVDLVGGLGWKASGILFLVIVIGLGIVALLLK